MDKAEGHNRYVRQVGRINSLVNQLASKVCEKDQHYRSSWRKRGGVGAFFVMARKWDRIEAAVETDSFGGEPAIPYDIFQRFQKDTRGESIVDDVLDLTGYFLILLEHMMEMGYIDPKELSRMLNADNPNALSDMLNEYWDTEIDAEEEIKKFDVKHKTVKSGGEE